MDEYTYFELLNLLGNSINNEKKYSFQISVSPDEKLTVILQVRYLVTGRTVEVLVI